MTIFVSYSRRDEDAVQVLAADLQRARQEVWLDHALGGGDHWWATILEQIRTCTAFVFALSNHSLFSAPCRSELAYAEALGIPILPVQIGALSSMRTDPIFRMQLVDYQSPTKDSAIDLVAALYNGLDPRKPPPNPLPEPPPIPYEYLQRLGKLIRAGDSLTFEQQAAIVVELRASLEYEESPSVRNDARKLLEELKRRKDVAWRAVQYIDEALLAEYRLAAEPEPNPPPQPLRPPHPPENAFTPPPVHEGIGPRYIRMPTESGRLVPRRATLALPDELHPSGVAVASNGCVYVIDDFKSRVVALSAEGTRLMPFSPAPGFSGIAVDSDETVYVVVKTKAQVVKLAAGSSTASNVQLPRGFTPRTVAVDGDRNLYVAGSEGVDGRVYKLADSPVELPIGNMGPAPSVAIDEAGNVYVADNTRKRVRRFAAGGLTSTRLELPEIEQPQAVAADPAGNLYILEQGGRLVRVASNSAASVEVEVEGLIAPTAIATDAQGSVYVVDTGDRRVFRLSFDDA